MSTYLKKRSIAEHGLPKVQGSYHVAGIDDQIGEEYLDTLHFELEKNCFIYDTDYSKITHWYEPLSLPQLLEEVKEELLKWVEEEGMFDVAPVDGYEKGEEHAFKMFKEKIISVFNSASSNNLNNH